jgi:hypothetical protein
VTKLMKRKTAAIVRFIVWPLRELFEVAIFGG